MALIIKPSAPDLIPAVQAFNERMEKGGSRWKFYDTDTPDWLAYEEGATAWREFFLLCDEASGQVRGGYGLKHEQFYLDGAPQRLGWLQGPVAESAVNRSLKGLGGVMIKDALARYPRQVSWGANSIAAPSAGDAPMLLNIVNKSAFVRQSPALRERSKLAAIARLSAKFGFAQVGLSLAQFASSLTGHRAGTYEITEEEGFGPWADEVWEAARGQYKLIALRDAATLNRALPRDTYPHAIILKVKSRGAVIGWAAVRDRRLSDDPLFGNLRAGSVIDALALPHHEGTVAAAASHHLRKRRVDFIGACFLHKRWISAFRGAGFLAIPGRRNVGFSPALMEEAGGVEVLMRGTHLALIDSDGPRIF